MDDPAVPDGPTPRRGGRVPVHFPVALRRRGEARFSVRIVDLSVHGFCSEVDDRWPIGTALWLTLPGLAPLEAKVAWLRDFKLGAEFLVPLHPSVLAAIVAGAR